MKTKHHRKPRKLGGTDEKRNIALVNHKAHQSWHLLFNHMNPYQIAEVINERWLDPDYQFVVKRR